MLSYRVARYTLFSYEFQERVQDHIQFLEKIRSYSVYCRDMYQEELEYCKKKLEQIERMRARYPAKFTGQSRKAKVNSENYDKLGIERT